MPTSRDILTLAQWFSPGFPVGSFAYSHGLEWAIETQQVYDARSAQSWIADVLEHGSGRNDCVFLAVAYEAMSRAEVAEIDARCRAFAASRERVKEADLQGAAFCDVVTAVWPGAGSVDLRGLAYPVAVGRAARAQELPLDLTQEMYLHSVLSNLVAVAMRLVPIGQTEGQRVIRALTPLVSEVASRAMQGGLDDLGATAFLSDIASMKHETQYSRIFRT